MAYDESEDLRQHEADVRGLTAIAGGLGAASTGYEAALDIGGGLGMHAPFLQEIASRVYVTDIIDYTSIYDGGLLPGVIAKYQRNGVTYDPARTEYHKVDAQKLIYRDGAFDCVFSVNAFEHIPDPRLAFNELLRVTRPGALVLLQFDPLWHSAFGHHLWSLNFEPWAHLLASEQQMHTAIRERGGTDAEIAIYDRETNRQPFALFRQMFMQEAPLHFASSYFNFWSRAPEDDPNAHHPNYVKCLELGYEPEELLVRGVQFVGVRA
jgi:SAM-dependent methyltransferase